jgi:hypothetical protein
LTGEPTSLDPQYLSERTEILRQPQGVQDAYARQYVNDLVAHCDAVDQAAAARVAYEAACLRLGGTLATSNGGGAVISVKDPKIAWAADSYTKGQCIVTYFVTEIIQSLTYVLPLFDNGSFDESRYSYNRDVRCQGHPEDFHSDTGVCLVVGFLG